MAMFSKVSSECVGSLQIILLDQGLQVHYKYICVCCFHYTEQFSLFSRKSWFVLLFIENLIYNNSAKIKKVR